MTTKRIVPRLIRPLNVLSHPFAETKKALGLLVNLDSSGYKPQDETVQKLFLGKRARQLL